MLPAQLTYPTICGDSLTDWRERFDAPGRAIEHFTGSEFIQAPLRWLWNENVPEEGSVERVVHIGLRVFAIPPIYLAVILPGALVAGSAWGISIVGGAILDHFPWDYSELHLNAWQSEGDIETAKERIRTCFRYGSDNLSLQNLQLTSLPDCIGNLQNLRSLDCSRNRLTALPENIVRLHRDCRVNAQRNLFSPDVMQQLEEASLGAEYMRLRGLYLAAVTAGDQTLINNAWEEMEQSRNNAPAIDLSIAAPDRQDRDPFELIAEFQQLCAGQPYAETDLGSLWANEADRELFGLWFSLMFSMPDYTSPGLRPILAGRVLSILDYAVMNPTAAYQGVGYKDILIGQIVEGRESCIDRVALSINRLQMYRGLCIASVSANEMQLLKLLKGCFNFEILEEIARAKVATLRFVDEIEVHLGFQIVLKNLHPELELPFDVGNMQFFACSRITPEDLENAWERLQAESSRGLVDYLLKSPLWTARLEASQKYRTVTAWHQIALVHAEDKLVEGKESDYLLEIKRIKNEKDTLLRKLTQSALKQLDPPILVTNHNSPR